MTAAMRTTLWGAVVAVAFVSVLAAGCDAGGAALDGVDEQAAAIGEPPGAPSTVLNVVNEPGGIMQNGLDLDDLLANGFVDPAHGPGTLALTALVSHSLYTEAGQPIPAAATEELVQLALDDPAARRLLRHIVECALPDNRSAAFKSRHGDWHQTIWGVAGVAPEWAADATATCVDQSCQRRISACVYETVNDRNRHEVISMRWPLSLGAAPVSPRELNTFKNVESVTYGNYFNPSAGSPVSWPEEGNYPLDMHLCLRDDFNDNDNLQAFMQRMCGDDHLPLCQRIIVGHCGDSVSCPKRPRFMPEGWTPPSWHTPARGKACAYGPDANGAVWGCVDHKNVADNVDACQMVSAGRNLETATVYRPKKCPDGRHDYEASPFPMPPECSPCVQLIGAYFPECTTTAWTSSCVDAARQLCAGHDLTERGSEPLDLGSAEVVDKVCEGDAATPALATCCTQKWRPECVLRAKSFYNP